MKVVRTYRRWSARKKVLALFWAARWRSSNRSVRRPERCAASRASPVSISRKRLVAKVTAFRPSAEIRRTSGSLHTSFLTRESGRGGRSAGAAAASASAASAASASPAASAAAAASSSALAL